MIAPRYLHTSPVDKEKSQCNFDSEEWTDAIWLANKDVAGLDKASYATRKTDPSRKKELANPSKPSLRMVIVGAQPLKFFLIKLL